MWEVLGFALIGLLGGVLGGLMGVGGATLIIPALVMIFGFSQKSAQGTTLMMMVPPIGILAAMEYYKAGEGNIKAAAIMAGTFFIGGFLGSKIALKIEPTTLRRIFSLFLIFIAIRMWFK